MRRTLLSFAIAVLVTVAASAQTFIKVRSQADFEAAPAKVERALRDGATDIRVTFASGRYYFNENHFRFYRSDAPEATISFIGDDAQFVGNGRLCESGIQDAEDFGGETGVVERANVDTWSRVYQTDRKVEILDKESGRCRLSCPDLPMRMKLGRNVYLLLTEWYRSEVCPVDRIEGGYVYFTVKDVGYVNNDYKYAKLYPRFKLAGTSLTPFAFKKPVWLCLTNRMFAFRECKLGGVVMEGLHFLGNSNGGQALMDFTDNNIGSVRIEGCHFEGLRSQLLQIAATDNVTFTDNTVTRCYAQGVNSIRSADTEVTDNHFNDVGKGMSNSFCISCSGRNYLVRDNVICDFGYGGISVGVWYKTFKDMESSGAVAGNELYYTKNYFAHYKEYTIMDSGAIYAYSQNDRAVICGNHIHDYTGMKDNRGIFLDDGACNVTVTGNVVRNVPNGWSIDSRRVKGIEKEQGSYLLHPNTGNIIESNDVDGKIRVEK